MSIVAVLLAGRLWLNATQAVTRGARPLKFLAVEAQQPIREAAHAALADLATRRFGRGIEWAAVIAPITNQDTVVLGLFRAEDTTLGHRLFDPDPAVSGIARYAVAEHRLAYLGVGVR